MPPGAFERQLDWLIQMAKNPGAKAHAWHRAKELDADSSGLFAGMAAALKAAMTGPAESGAPAGPTPTKPPSASPRPSTAPARASSGKP